ncbi:MAG TPA: CDGSH iron-sulfur domain-containing protein [Acidimicrobiales bacterium]
MADDDRPVPSITAAPNGPYLVGGDVPLYRRRAVHSEHGEPLTWVTTEQLEPRERYALCRCGQSANKPYCDGTHARVGFEALDDAPSEQVSGHYDDRARPLGGTGIAVRDDRSICVHAGFCGNRVANVWKLTGQTGESTVRAQVIAMVERCPSGALTYQLDGSDVEPLLPAAISVIRDGPLWVTGRIPVSAGGAPLEARNRVTLCRCGQSAHKPLCDGTHKEVGFTDPVEGSS